MALTLQQVQKKAMALKAKEVQAKIEQAAQFGQPMLMGATDDVTGEEGNDPVGLADGGLVGNAAGVLKNRSKQLDEQEAKALAPPKEEKPMPKVEKKPEEKPRSFLETAKKAVFGFKDGGRVGCADGGLVRGPGTGTSDSVKAKGPSGEEIRLSDGEVVLPADTVQKLGVKNLENVIDQTHTPVKAKFGNGFAGGLVPYDPIQGQRFAPVNTPPGAVNPNFVTGESPEARDFTRRQFRAEAKAAAERAVQNAKAAVPPAESPNASRLGRAAKWLGKVAVPISAAAGAYTSFGDTDAQRRKYDDIVPSWDGIGGDLVRNAARVGTHVGNAVTGGVAGRFGRGIAETGSTEALLNDDLSINPKYDLVKRVEAFKKGFLSAPGDASVDVLPHFGIGTKEPSTAPAAPSTKTPSGELMGPPGDLATPPDPLKTWQAQALAGMGAGPGSGYQARPDLGAPGEQWMRRGNSYVGVGNGPQKGNGIDFGFSRPSMQAAIAASGNSGYPEAPTYQENPAVSRLQSQIEQTAERLAQIKPGEVGGRALTNKLTALQGAMAALQAPSAAVNAFNEKRYENEVSKFGAAQTARAQDATNRLEREKAGYAFAKDTAAARNAAATHKDAQDQIRLTNSNELLKAAAGEDKKKASSLLAAAGFRNFKGADGKTYKFHELNAEDRANNMGILENMAANIATNQEAGKAVSWADADVVGEATGPGFIKALVQDPVGVTLHGTRQLNGNWSTAGTNRPPSHEAALAQLKQHAAAREYNSSMRRTPEARAAALRALVLAGNDPELAERALAK